MSRPGTGATEVKRGANRPRDAVRGNFDALGVRDCDTGRDPPKSPAQIAELRFADIACGSGSFLLGVYDLLIRYHTKFYNENPGKAKKGDVVQRDDGLHLSLQKKRQILVANIYGVDIDMQAVEVAQLSLYLKLLQDETPASAREHQLEFHETLLPTLNKNIVCCNSLIGTDILDGQLFEPTEERKLNPMNFEDAFPHIFKRKSFGEMREAAASPLDFDLPGVPMHGSYSDKKLKNPPKAKLPPSNPQVRDWICQAWVTPEERERRLREIFGRGPRETPSESK